MPHGFYELHLGSLELYLVMLVSLLVQEVLPFYLREGLDFCQTPVDLEKIQQHFVDCFLYQGPNTVQAHGSI